MIAGLETAGERISLECDLEWVGRLLVEAAAGRLTGAVDGSTM